LTLLFSLTIDVDLGLWLDSIFTNETQVELGHEYSERKSQCWNSTNCKTCRVLRMKQSRSMFYREEQTGGERRSEMKDDGRTPSAPMAEHLSLWRPSPYSVSKGGVICWFLLDMVRDPRPGGSREHAGQFAY
jgi:hypothetical protein